MHAVLLPLLSLSLTAAPPASAVRAERVQRLEAFIAAPLDPAPFSGAVLVARDGKVLLSRGYGHADLAGTVRNAPATKFRIGSLTKQFTAAAILQLEAAGKLGVKDAVCKHVSPCPEAWQPVTLHHLLTHTSGLPDHTDGPAFPAQLARAHTPGQLLEEVRTQPLEFAPGARFEYANTNDVLLGQVVERASSQPYAKYVQTQLFAPLGMKSSGYGDPARGGAEGSVQLGEERVPARPLHMANPSAAGGLHSTVEDLLRWERGLTDGKLLPPAALSRMFTPDKEGYAYGWGVGELSGNVMHAHGGAINGFASHLLRLPRQGLTVIVLSNVSGGVPQGFAEDLARIALGEQVALPHVRETRLLP